MLQAINTKLLIAVLAAIAGLSAVIVHQQHEIQDARTQAAKATALLEEQKREAEKQQRAWEEFKKQVDSEKHKAANYDTKKADRTWRTYVP